MMSELTVKQLMLPKNQYATVRADSTLGDAVLALRNAQHLEQSLDAGRHRDRAILVVDEYNQVVGKLSMLNILRGFLPQYERAQGAKASSKAAARIGSARAFLDAQEARAGLWQKPLENLAGKAARTAVRQLLRPFADGETIDEEGSLDTALQQMVTGRFQSLLVTRDGEIVGILRLTDVYEEIARLLIAGATDRA
jgi:CBS domain-containing protein